MRYHRYWHQYYPAFDIVPPIQYHVPWRVPPMWYDLVQYSIENDLVIDNDIKMPWWSRHHNHIDVSLVHMVLVQ